jgi:hypothetical protein
MKIISSLLLAIILVISCTKQSSNLEDKTTTKNPTTKATVESSLTDYFTGVELEYLYEYFGEFDMSSVLQSTQEDGTKTTVVFSQNNTSFSKKKLIISEKTVNGIDYVKKEIFSVSSTSETIEEVIENYSNPNLHLSREIVNINVGSLYSIAQDDKITEIDLGFNAEAKGPFGPCFKSCYRDGILAIGKNFAAAVICSLNIPECMAGIAAACTWECLF